MSNILSEIISGLKHTAYIYSHPFDGFWTLKSEKKGNLKSATVIFILLIITTAYRILGSEYLFASPTLESFSVWLLMLAVALLVALYCVANWAITTLLDGKGSMAEIYISLMYALTPLVIVNVPLTVATHFIVLEEAAFYTLINIITVVVIVFLILAANLSIHEYTMLKSFLTTVLTLAAMVGILILAVLFFNLAQQLWLWIVAIVTEILYRL